MDRMTRLALIVLAYCFLFAAPALAQVPTVQPAPPPPAPPQIVRTVPENWPTKITADDGFAKLGQAIQSEPDFPKTGSATDKANYVMTKLPLVAQYYGLTAGSGWPPSQALIGISRAWEWVMDKVGGPVDPENTGGLKGVTGIGNCGEWSYMFSEILVGAGVDNSVVFADVSPNPGASSSHSLTDTAVMVIEKLPGGRTTRRIYDSYQAAYYHDSGKPDDTSVKLFTNLPLSPSDMTAADKAQKYPSKPIWLHEMKKPFVKDAKTETVIDEPEQKTARLGRLKGMVKNTVDDTAVAGAAVEISGPNGFSQALVTQSDGSFSAGLNAGDYTVTVTGPGKGSTAAVTIQWQELATVALTVTPDATSTQAPSFLGDWEGRAKVLKCTDATIVGQVVPYDLSIVKSGNGVTLATTTRGLTGLPSSYKTKDAGEHLHLDYSGPALVPPVPYTTITIVFALDVTASADDKLTGTLSSTTKADYSSQIGQSTTSMYIELALKLTRKTQ